MCEMSLAPSATSCPKPLLASGEGSIGLNPVVGDQMLSSA
jgi:hypothetical protein